MRSFITHYFFLTKRCAMYEYMGQLLSFISFLFVVIATRTNITTIDFERMKNGKASKRRNHKQEMRFIFITVLKYPYKKSQSFVVRITVLLRCENSFKTRYFLLFPLLAVVFLEVLMQDGHLFYGNNFCIIFTTYFTQRSKEVFNSDKYCRSYLMVKLCK